MTHREYKEILEYELYREFWGGGNNPCLLKRIRIKYFQPNTNCMYLCRKMWYLYSKGKIGKFISKFLYLRILHRYSCSIAADAQVGKGFIIVHPVGIVMGGCVIGENFTIFQNSTIGAKEVSNSFKELPVIGKNVILASNSLILGGVTISNDVVVGANSLVVKDINEAGTYAGSPVRKLN